jgi:lipoprotein-anchoring transpeptidase ErfK/SrfK
MTERVTRSGVPERRDHTPPGRLRRIFHDYRGATAFLLLLVVGAAVLLAATSAWAVGERLDRRVTEMVYGRDVRSLNFLREKEAELTRAAAEKERTLTAREEELLPSDRPYLVVSLAERRVLYLEGDDTLFSAPVAVGSGATLVLGGKTKRFQTPRGKMSITHKERDPVWVPPNWHYIEVARKKGLRVVDMSNAAPNALASFPAGDEPIRDGTIYIPPWGSPQRQHKGVLGVAKLEMYDGYYFHGTDNEASVGTAASHGCLRMRRGDIVWMYDNVPVGTPVFIY